MKTKKFRNPVLHPFLFALYPILFLYSHNVGEASLSYVVFPAALVLASTTALYLLLRLASVDSGRAGIYTSVPIIMFFSFGLLMDLLKRAEPVFLLYGVAIGLSYLALKGTRCDLTTATKLLNVISIALILIPSSNILLHRMSAPETPTDRGGLPVETHGNISDLPDIYYIVLDEYPRDDMLKRVCDFDNTEFLNLLRERGFYVAQKSRSNYGTTYISMASSLNMEYVNYLGDKLGKKSTDYSLPFRMIKDSKVSRYLKSRGYTYINLRSSFGPTNDNEYADLEFGCSPYGQTNEFMTVLIDTTVLQPFAGFLFLKNIRKCRLYNFEKLADISLMEEPTFTLAHIMLPHSPYIFDENGDPAADSNLSYYCSPEVWTNSLFTNQLAFVNKKVEEAVDAILSRSQRPPIIVIQADHGSASVCQQWAEDVYAIPQDKMDERVAILNAYYLPDGGNELLYDTITPVNTFRIIFNHYFNENYSMLEDESYISTLNYRYEFRRVEP